MSEPLRGMRSFPHLLAQQLKRDCLAGRLDALPGWRVAVAGAGLHAGSGGGSLLKQRSALAQHVGSLLHFTLHGAVARYFQRSAAAHCAKSSQYPGCRVLCLKTSRATDNAASC